MQNSLPKAAGLIIPGILLALMGLAALYFRLDPAQHPFPRCPVHWLTGWYCPGCGTQRALHALLHGQWMQAANLNLLAVLFLPVVAIGLPQEFLFSLRAAGRGTSWLYRPWFGWLAAGATVVFTLLRNTPSSLGLWLAP